MQQYEYAGSCNVAGGIVCWRAVKTGGLDSHATPSRSVKTWHSLQLHGPGCGTCTYNGGKIGIKESKCTRVSDVKKYALVAGTVGTRSSIDAELADVHESDKAAT